MLQSTTVVAGEWGFGIWRDVAEDQKVVYIINESCSGAPSTGLSSCKSRVKVGRARVVNKKVISIILI